MLNKFIFFLKQFFSSPEEAKAIPSVSEPPETYPIEWLQSPNFSSRRGKTPEVIVLHHTGSLSLKSAISWFQTTQSQVSAHYVINLDGKIVQMVKDEDRAWHAGDSVWSAKKDVNSISIGIEIVGDGKTPFTEMQYKVVAWLCRELKKKYSILDIVGHADIAVPKGRKIDPRPFDWGRFKQLLDK